MNNPAMLRMKFMIYELPKTPILTRQGQNKRQGRKAGSHLVLQSC
jgi:hypothetical protein